MAHCCLTLNWKPTDFWAASLKEVMVLLENQFPEAVNSLNSTDLTALMARFPD